MAIELDESGEASIGDKQSTEPTRDEKIEQLAEQAIVDMYEDPTSSVDVDRDEYVVSMDTSEFKGALIGFSKGVLDGVEKDNI